MLEHYMCYMQNRSIFQIMKACSFQNYSRKCPHFDCVFPGHHTYSTIYSRLTLSTILFCLFIRQPLVPTRLQSWECQSSIVMCHGGIEYSELGCSFHQLHFFIMILELVGLDCVIWIYLKKKKINSLKNCTSGIVAFHICSS